MKIKKIGAIVLATATVAAMCFGCGKAPAEEKPYEVVMEIVTLGQEFKDIPAIEEAINAISVPAINCEVSLLPVAIPDHANKMSMMIAGGEKLDLCMVGLTTNLSTMVTDGMLCSLDEYMEDNGKGLEEVFGTQMESGVVNGKLYGIPADNVATRAGGFVYNKEMADAAGVEIPEFCTLDDMEMYFTKVKEVFPDVYFTTQGNGQVSGADMAYPMTKFGDEYYSYGIIFNPGENTTIENWYASEEAREYYKRIRRWNEEGWIPSDSITSGVLARDMMKTQQIFTLGTAYSPRQISTLSVNYDFTIGMTQASEALIDTTALQECMWGVPVTSENPRKAVEFLNLLYTNTDVANLLTNGLEGVNYEKTEAEGIVRQLDKDAPGYLKVFGLFGDQTKVDYQEPAKEGVQEELKEFADNAKLAVALGYVFDSTKVAAQASAAANVVQQYGPSLETGIIPDVDSALDQLVSEMEKAGINEVIAENQAQLDAWLSSK